MDVQLQSIGFTATDKLKDFIQKRLDKLRTYFENIISVDVFLKLDSHQQVKDKVVEIKLNIPGATLFASETAKTFEEAVDLSVESIRRQLKKRKEKMRS